MRLGGNGNVTGTAKGAQKAMRDWGPAAWRGDAKQAAARQLALMPVHKAMFIEANPITVKWASAKLGLSGAAIRLPMTQLSAHAHAEVEAAVRECGLLQ